MVARTALIQSRKTTRQNTISQVGGPWTDLTFQQDDIRKSVSPQITNNGAGVFTTTQSGYYLVKYFVAIDAINSVTNDLACTIRAVINGSAPINPGYSCFGSYSAGGRHGVGHSFLVYISSTQDFRLQYRFSQNGAVYSGTPVQDFGGTTLDTGTGVPPGPAVCSFSMERVNEEFGETAYHQVYLTGNIAITSAATWLSVPWNVDGGRAFFPRYDETRLTIPETGYYLIGYNLSYDEIPTASWYNQQLRGQVLRNGGTVLNGSRSTSGNHMTLGNDCTCHAFLALLTEGDYIELQYYVSAINANIVLGGSTAPYREKICSMYALKVSDHASTTYLTQAFNRDIEEAAIGASSTPAGWGFTISDTNPIPVRWHISNNRFVAPATRSVRYARDLTNNFQSTPTAQANNGTLNTPLFDIQSGLTSATIEFDVFLAGESSTSYDHCELRLISNGLGTLNTWNKIALGGMATVGTWRHITLTVSSSALGRGDLYLQFYFNTIDTGANTYEGAYFCNFEVKGVK